MGLVKAAMNAASGVMADQWKEFFYCDALPAEVLAVKGQKRTDRRSANKHGNENIISDGSIVAVAEGQCALIVEQGKVVELCAEPGEYIYSTGTQPSLLSGGLKDIDGVFAEMGKRFGFGGQAAADQRIYYINTKELVGNKYGTPNPVPFRVVDQRAGIDLDIAIRCFGEYSYRIVNPILFYTNVCGNVENAYLRETLDSQLKTELLTALQPAFAKISEQGIRYSALPGHTMEMADALNEEDEAMLKAMQRDAAYMDPTRGAAHLVGAQGDAMRAAAANTSAGPAMAFMGVNAAAAAGGADAQTLYQMGARQAAAQPAPAPAAGWKCACGQSGNTGKFCTACGAPKPEAPTVWVCSCGTKNSGKFCSECGKPRPAAQCANCGWKPADPTRLPKFCPECGKPFGA